MQTILDNAATAVRMFELFNRGEIDKLIPMMPPRVLWQVSGAPPIPYARTYRGQKEVTTFFAELANAVTFTEFVPDKIVNADEHTVVSIGHFSAIAKPTGKETKSDWVIIFEFDEEGILVRYKDYVDTQSIAEAYR